MKARNVRKSARTFRSKRRVIGCLASLNLAWVAACASPPPTEIVGSKARTETLSLGDLEGLAGVGEAGITEVAQTDRTQWHPVALSGTYEHPVVQGGSPDSRWLNAKRTVLHEDDVFGYRVDDRESKMQQYVVATFPEPCFGQPDCFYAITDVATVNAGHAWEPQYMRGWVRAYVPLVNGTPTTRYHIDPDPEYSTVSHIKYSQGLGTLFQPYQDVNAGIGGDYVGIWVKYGAVSARENERVATAVSVSHWPHWNKPYPCPEGYEPAHGNNDGGKLTSRTQNSCDRMGLCVKYSNAGDVWEHGYKYLTSLDLSFDGSGGHNCAARASHSPLAEVSADIHRGCGDDTWVRVCSYKSRTREVSDADLKRWLNQHKPFLKFDQTERTRDMLISIDRFAANMGHWCDQRMGSNGYSIQNGGLGLLCDRPAGLPDSQANDRVVYGFAQRTANGYALTYFMLFPWNEASSFAVRENHVGDWERVTINLEHENLDALPVPVQMVFEAHGDVTAVPWSEVEKQDPDGNHPVVYLAGGRHGTYPHAGTEIWPPGEYHRGDGLAFFPHAVVPFVVMYSDDDWNFQSLDGRPEPAFGQPAACGDAPPEGRAIYRWGDPECGTGPTGPQFKNIWSSQ